MIELTEKEKQDLARDIVWLAAWIGATGLPSHETIRKYLNQAAALLSEKPESIKFEVVCATVSGWFDGLDATKHEVQKPDRIEAIRSRICALAEKEEKARAEEKPA